MTLIATAEPDAWPPRVKLETDGAAVTRTDASGDVVTVRGGVVNGVIYDYEAPQGVALTYEGDSGDWDTVALPDVGNWLVHLSRPELSYPLEVQAEGDVEMPARVSSARPYSGRAMSAATGNRDWVQSSMTVHGITREDVMGLLDLLYDQTVLFLSTHPGHDDEGPRYVRVLDVSKRRFINACESPRRILTLPYLVQDRPSVIEADAYGWDLMPTKWWAGMPTLWGGMP